MDFIKASIFLLLLIPAATAVQLAQFEYGGMKATVVSDGPFQTCEGGFRIPNDQIADAFAAQLRKPRPLVLGLNVLVVDINNKRVLVDPGTQDFSALGVTGFRNAGKMVNSLKVAGINPDSIDMIVMTHGVFDHFSGMTTPDGKRVFKNANVYLAKAEYDFWQNPPNTTDASVAVYGKLASTILMLGD